MVLQEFESIFIKYAFAFPGAGRAQRVFGLSGTDCYSHRCLTSRCRVGSLVQTPNKAHLSFPCLGGHGHVVRRLQCCWSSQVRPRVAGRHLSLRSIWTGSEDRLVCGAS